MARDKKPQKPFYECASIHLYVDQGHGCTRVNNTQVHPIACGCPCNLVAKNDRSQIKRFGSPEKLEMAIATIQGNGFGISSSGKLMVNIYFYKI